MNGETSHSGEGLGMVDSLIAMSFKLYRYNKLIILTSLNYFYHAHLLINCLVVSEDIAYAKRRFTYAVILCRKTNSSSLSNGETTIPCMFSVTDKDMYGVPFVSKEESMLPMFTEGVDV